MRVLIRLIPLTLLALLAACAGPAPAPGSAGPMSRSAQPESGSALPVREQGGGPPQPLLEHPGRPPANGHVWIAGRWDLLEGRYRWQPGNWVAPRPGHVWQPHVWRLAADGWVQEGGRWVPDPNGLVRPRRR